MRHSRNQTFFLTSHITAYHCHHSPSTLPQPQYNAPMPKVSRVGKFRATAKSSSPSAPPKASPNENNDASDKSSSLSRGQRKRQAKREQYMKREKMILSSLRLQKLQEEKGRLDGFEAVRLSLPEYTKVPKSDADVKTKSVVVSNSNKSKKTIGNS